MAAEGDTALWGTPSPVGIKQYRQLVGKALSWQGNGLQKVDIWPSGKPYSFFRNMEKGELRKNRLHFLGTP